MLEHAKDNLRKDYSNNRFQTAMPHTHVLPVFLHRQELVSQATPFTERGRVWLVRLGEEPWYEEHHRTINASRVTGFLSGALNSSEYY